MNEVSTEKIFPTTSTPKSPILCLKIKMLVLMMKYIVNSDSKGVSSHVTYIILRLFKPLIVPFCWVKTCIKYMYMIHMKGNKIIFFSLSVWLTERGKREWVNEDGKRITIIQRSDKLHFYIKISKLFYPLKCYHIKHAYYTMQVHHHHFSDMICTLVKKRYTCVFRHAWSSLDYNLALIFLLLLFRFW